MNLEHTAARLRAVSTQGARGDADLTFPRGIFVPIRCLPAVHLHFHSVRRLRRTARRVMLSNQGDNP